MDVGHVILRKKVNFAQSRISTKKRSSYDISTKIKAIEFAIDTTSGHDAKLSLVGSALLRAGRGHYCPATWFMRTLAGDCLQARLVHRPVSFSGLVKEVPLGNRGPGF